MALNWNTVQIGDALPSRELGPISRLVLALYAGGSGDHNPMHVDSDFAKQGGMPDVFAHGMLSMAYLAQSLTTLVRSEQIRSYSVRFASITPVNARITCRGNVVEKLEAEGERRLRLQLQAVTDGGIVTLQGDAVVAI
jgi:acyl dehydratase